jgi:hypothetical protein
MDQRSSIQYHIKLGRQAIEELLEDDQVLQTLIEELESESDNDENEPEERRRRPNIDRDRYDFHDKLMNDYIVDNATYERQFSRRYTMTSSETSLRISGDSVAKAVLPAIQICQKNRMFLINFFHLIDPIVLDGFIFFKIMYLNICEYK